MIDLGQELVDESNFKDDLGADSLDLAELWIVFYEEFELDMEISDASAQRIKTVGDAVTHLEQALT